MYTFTLWDPSMMSYKCKIDKLNTISFVTDGDDHTNVLFNFTYNLTRNKIVVIHVYFNVAHFSFALIDVVAGNVVIVVLIKIFTTLPHTHTHHQYYTLLVGPLCLEITLLLCLVKITCEFCYMNRIIRWGLGPIIFSWMSARDKMLGRFCNIYAIVCVLWIGKEDRERRERKYFVVEFWTIIYGEIFSTKSIPHLTSSFAVSPSFVVQNEIRSGVVVVLLFLLLCLHRSYTGIQVFFMCVCKIVW